MSSVFTRIIRREVPAEIVYETEETIAFLDINPKSVGHTLVVPKREVAAYHDLLPPELSALALSVRTVARAVTRAMGTPHYNLMVNNGAPAGQIVFHVHFHVVPRYTDPSRLGRPGPLTPAQAEEQGAAIRRALAELGDDRSDES
jgi:histidine triad (HIT) family protein